MKGMKSWAALVVFQLLSLTTYAGEKRDITALPVDRGARSPAGQPVWADGPQSIERTVSEGPTWYRDPKALAPEEPKKGDGPVRVETVDEMAPALRKIPYVK